ncbi:hypothetical protein LPJ61_006554, partial [Coemansia biformis]
MAAVATGINGQNPNQAMLSHMQQQQQQQQAIYMAAMNPGQPLRPDAEAGSHMAVPQQVSIVPGGAGQQQFVAMTGIPGAEKAVPANGAGVVHAGMPVSFQPTLPSRGQVVDPQQQAMIQLQLQLQPGQLVGSQHLIPGASRQMHQAGVGPGAAPVASNFGEGAMVNSARSAAGVAPQVRPLQGGPAATTKKAAAKPRTRKAPKKAAKTNAAPEPRPPIADMGQHGGVGAAGADGALIAYATNQAALASGASSGANSGQPAASPAAAIKALGG